MVVKPMRGGQITFIRIPGVWTGMETLHVATSEARAGLLADIVGHPTMATIQELDYLNPP